VTDQHYFSERPQAAHRRGEVRVVLPDVHLRLETDSGTFSAGRLDPGTRVLLDTVPAPPPAGDLLDLGCGYGPVALTMAARSPGATVWAVDTNVRALELCVKNAARAGLHNVRCITPGQAPPGTRYAVLWSNPPIRIGKAALHDLLTGWLGRLVPGGTAYLVVQRNLGADSLHRWLSGEGWAVRRVTSRAGYRVLRVQNGDQGQVPGQEAAHEPR
jgi:16S rRNA (guanine1207-N2)-methyltransferase